MTIDVGNLTLKQLLQLYQLREEKKSASMQGKSESSIQLGEDTAEFLKLLVGDSELPGQGNSEDASSESESLVRLIDNLIDSIESK